MGGRFVKRAWSCPRGSRTVVGLVNKRLPLNAPRQHRPAFKQKDQPQCERQDRHRSSNDDEDCHAEPTAGMPHNAKAASGTQRCRPSAAKGCRPAPEASRHRRAAPGRSDCPLRQVLAPGVGHGGARGRTARCWKHRHAIAGLPAMQSVQQPLPPCTDASSTGGVRACRELVTCGEQTLHAAETLPVALGAAPPALAQAGGGADPSALRSTVRRQRQGPARSQGGAPHGGRQAQGTGRRAPRPAHPAAARACWQPRSSRSPTRTATRRSAPRSGPTWCAAASTSSPTTKARFPRTSPGRPRGRRCSSWCSKHKPGRPCHAQAWVAGRSRAGACVWRPFGVRCSSSPFLQASSRRAVTARSPGLPRAERPRCRAR